MCTSKATCHIFPTVTSLVVFLTLIFSFIYYERCYKPSLVDRTNNSACRSYELISSSIDIKTKDAPKVCNNTYGNYFEFRSTSFISDRVNKCIILCDINCYERALVREEGMEILYNSSNKNITPITNHVTPALRVHELGIKNIGVYECCSKRANITGDIRYKYIEYIHYIHFSGQINSNYLTGIDYMKISNGDLLFMVDFEYASDELIWYWVNSRDIQYVVIDETKYFKKQEFFLDAYETVTRNNSNIRVRTILKINPLDHKNSVIKFIIKSCLSKFGSYMFQHRLTN